MANNVTTDNSSTEEGAGADDSGGSPDKPPATNGVNGNSRKHVPLPPRNANAHEKAPELPKDAPHKVEPKAAVPGAGVQPKQAAASTGALSKQHSMASNEDTDSASIISSTNASRAPSRAPSRVPSMNGNGSKPAAPLTKASSKPGVASHDFAPSPHKPGLSRPPSENGDGNKHKFNLKDLLASGPQKLGRRSSQRSTASSRRSESPPSHKGEGKKKSTGGSRAGSEAGDSTTSLSKKYGVCQKVAIGKGATSVVRLAHKWDRSDGEKLYAVKEFRKRRKTESEKEYVKKLTAEFCISSTLHHINVVETVDLIQDEQHNWCEVMEFCPGGDLYGAIKKGGMSPSEVECCFKQILYGVRYLHSQGVAHRDIKPENIFFDRKGHVKIGDYGASTVYRLPWEATVHMSTGLCGSEPYIAPEQFLGKPYDARLVDIWAVAVVYYCLHFQELPWRAAQATDTLYAAYASACSSGNPSPQTINNLSPRACRTLMRKMLEPNPTKRASIESIFEHEWVKSIEVCWEKGEGQEGHVHVNARAVSSQVLRDVGM
ncbi:kinase-like domain-containing protein [Schizophyllum amplum]|uniref:non-specific serine/threonine protein kinase n=1 Tax=Schizophyllum amplum TaxID=97359 RepID=A0A550CE03_9AGAR|nr:kinase-like domain-containing protein [Auriculariopsis ampla]